MNFASLWLKRLGIFQGTKMRSVLPGEYLQHYTKWISVLYKFLLTKPSIMIAFRRNVLCLIPPGPANFRRFLAMRQPNCVGVLRPHDLSLGRKKWPAHRIALCRARRTRKICRIFSGRQEDSLRLLRLHDSPLECRNCSPHRTTLDRPHGSHPVCRLFT
jgi:hypothetical protein